MDGLTGRPSSMFNLLRYFSLTSAVVVVMATFGVISLYRHVAVDDIVGSAETENTGLAQSFADEIWPAFAPHFLAVDGTELTGLRTSVETSALHLSLESLTRGLPVLKVRIYTRGGALAYSSRVEEIGLAPAAGPPLRAAMDGVVSSALAEREDYVMPSGTAQKRHLVETYLPILGEEGELQGIFELHTDVTDLMVGIRDTISGMVLAILLAFAALYGALYLIVRRADRILKEQYQDLLSGREKLQAQNDELQREIAERIRAEQALISANRAAEAANRAKSEFLANMSHELRTPLNAVIGFSDSMLQGIFGQIRNRKYLEYIRDIGGAGRHLLAVINDILDLSKVEAGEETLDESELDLGESIASCRTLVQGWAEKAEVELTTEIPQRPILLLADARKCRQILLNLVSNAIKFTPAGGRVTIRARREAGQACAIEVQDTGIGMDEADIPKALAIFGQVDSGLSRQFDGTGLGLPLAKRLAELHGAELEIESARGAGTTVTVRFGPARTRSDSQLIEHAGRPESAPSPRLAS